MITFTIFPRWGCFTVNIIVLHGPQTGFSGLIDMYEYMYCWKTTSLYIFFNMFSDIKMIFNDSLTYYLSLLPVGSDTYVKFICISFVWSHCVTTSGLYFLYSIYYIEENGTIRKNIYDIIWYSKRNNCIVKNIIIVF